MDQRACGSSYRGVVRMKILFIDGAWAKPNACALFEDGKPTLFWLSTYLVLDTVIRTGHLDLVIMEGVYLRKDPSVVIKLAYNIGVVLGMCIRSQVPMKLLHPATWKHGVGLWGVKDGDLKEQIYQSYTDVKNPDLHDAIVMGYFYISHPNPKVQTLYIPDDVSQKGKLYAQGG